MSIEVMNAVWSQSKAEGRARLVLLAIADMQGELGAWPSISTLARMVNASERSVKRDIKTLQELGELIVHNQAAPVDAQYRPNRYFVSLSGVTDSVTGVTDGASGVTAQVSRGDSSGKSGVTGTGTLSLNRTLKNPNRLLDEDFWPNEKAWETMEEHFPHLDLKLETHAFIDYWISKGSMKKDWNAAWRNWIRMAHKISQKHGNRKVDEERRRKEIEELYATEGDRDSAA